MHTLQLPEVSFEATESANSLDTAFSTLFVLVFLPIKDFWVVIVCLIFVVMTVQLGVEKND